MDNWLVWQSVEGRVSAWVKHKWIDPDKAAEVLSAGRLQFVESFRPGRGLNAFQSAVDCCKIAARKLGDGYWQRSNLKPRVYADLEDETEDPRHEVLNLDEMIDFRSRREQLDDVFRQHFPAAEAFWQAIKDGHERHEAANITGLTQVCVSKLLAKIKKKIGK